jgi:hypothetical protein
MFGMGAMGMFMVAVPLLAVPADAQQDAERQKIALTQFSDELASCHAYCLTISRCLEAPNGVHTPADLSTSQQYSIDAKKLRQLAFLFSRSAGRADAATSAVINRAIQNAAKRVQRNCANVASVANQHGKECQELAEHPDDRLETLLSRSP